MLPKRAIAGAMLVLAVGLGACEETETNPYRITAEDVVDTLEPGTVATFCASYAVLDDFDLAVAAFSQGYTEPDPSAEEVVTEILSRC